MKFSIFVMLMLLISAVASQAGVSSKGTVNGKVVTADSKNVTLTLKNGQKQSFDRTNCTEAATPSPLQVGTCTVNPKQMIQNALQQKSDVK